MANGPAWHDRFPVAAFGDIPDDAFAPRHRIVRYFEDFAASVAAPVRCGVEVQEARKVGDRFRVETSEGMIEAESLVAATGPFQRPVVPALVPEEAVAAQMHSSAYRNPAQLPPGAVLVVGAGSSGAQIAEELAESGRRVFLSVGPHDRPPRRYRGRDFTWRLGVLGHWDATAPTPDREHATIAVSGANGGRTMDFRRLAAQGVTILGRAEGFAEGRLAVAADLQRNLARGDANHLAVLDQADAHARAHGLDLPREPEARAMLPGPGCLLDPILSLDLAAEGVGAIVWATGYRLDFGWLKIPAFDARGRPLHNKGVAEVPGLYFLGLPWLSCRGSAFIWGAWKDAARLADHIAARRTARGAPVALAGE